MNRRYHSGLFPYLLLLLWPLWPWAAEPNSALYSATPPLVGQSPDPLVMLVMSVDHELFKKAYSDYSDLDEDGRLDTSYNDRFDYSGYFNSQWCYRYDRQEQRYQPEQPATGSNNHFCTDGQAPWSGNFLNWATMSRMDILRRVLFGGKRQVDSDRLTVLERAYLPRDIHSFVKVYRGTAEAPVASLTPFTDSTISLCNLAVVENGPPVVRVAAGEWPRWASTEERQCQWGQVDSPSIASRLTEEQVYIAACVLGRDADDARYCQAYRTGAKPVGLLQRYGEQGIRFGLLSGSYDRNIAGGLLRRNIARITGNKDNAENELDPDTGIFNSTARGIIDQLNRFRIAHYSYAKNRYTDCSSPGISAASFTGQASRATRSSRHCSNWGNPLAEMYLEALRYFAGARKPSAQYDTDNDSYFVEGLGKADWQVPQGPDNACAQCAIILLSTGLNSFDSDQFAAAGDVPGIQGAAGVNKLTDQVGLLEAQVNPLVRFPGLFLADKPGGNRQCEATEISRLSDVRGICPEQPQLQGGYQLAGLAWHGRTMDLRPDLAGRQSVKTYAIELAEAVPSFSLDVAGQTVVFQPLCQAYARRSECSLTDVVVDRLAEDKKSGRFIFTWEDSLWGNDYDYDASSSIDYCIGEACSPAVGDSQVRMTVRQEAKNAGAETWYSYTVTGTDKDGLVLPLAQDSGDAIRQGAGREVTTIFNATGAPATQLPRPLWFAAKYGGFTDSDGDGSPGFDHNGDQSPDPGDSREWDNRNNSTGARGGDGLPDNYMSAKNPSHLEAQLSRILQTIASQPSSATPVTLVANDYRGVGAVYQALFQPQLEFNRKKIRWGGQLHALLVDARGWLREDGNGNGRLDDEATDRVVELLVDEDSRQGQIQRFQVSEGERIADGPPLPMTALKPLWNARDRLGALTDPVTQRAYGALASAGRHIITWLDGNHNNRVDAGEIRPFVPGSFSNREGYLNVPASQVPGLVNYIRGQEQPGSRSRVIDYNRDGQEEVWRLGDIVNATPVAVGAPDSGFALRYQDSSYRAFQTQYKNRRQVVYVGANDGLLHAFNGGFWQSDQAGYSTRGVGDETAHPLGSELWAYAPMNLLPHLRWLTEADYPHVYYMDGAPQAFDVRIFPPDRRHPGGWGTILVAGMGLGGGALTVTADGQQRTLRSAYVVLDITDPEQPPQVLAEITHPDLGFTLSRPALVKRRRPEGDSSGTAVNDWFLLFASGPAADVSAVRNTLERGDSQQNLRVFAYDLQENALATLATAQPALTRVTEASYGGDMTAVDWNQDYQDDVVYFGTVQSTGTHPGGALLRLVLATPLSASRLSVLLNTGQPSLAAPVTLKKDSDRWVYSGTGRLLVPRDNSRSQQNSFYGIREPVNSTGEPVAAEVAMDSLINTSSIEVLTSGAVRQNQQGQLSPLVIADQRVDSFRQLKQLMASQPGWKLDLRHDGDNPSGRSLSPARAFFSTVLFTEYQPSQDLCRMTGTGLLHGLHYLTGTAAPLSVLGSRQVDHGENAQAIRWLDLQAGYLSAPVIHQGNKGQASAVVQGAGGSIRSRELNYVFSSSGRQSWRQIFEAHPAASH